jgi:predicted DNA-binding ribbon-helix-helix protein
VTKQSELAVSAERDASPNERTSAKRSVVVGRRKTSVSIDDTFWDALREIAKERGERLVDLIAAIHAGRRHGNLSSAIRLFVLRYHVDQLIIPLLPDAEEIERP